MQIEMTNYTLPAHWASALINDDRTGLEDDDERELDSWLAWANPGHCVDVTGEPEFRTQYDADGLPCDCLEFSFQECQE